jgi:hypothetical protein
VRGSEFKPQYHQKKKRKKENPFHLLLVGFGTLKSVCLDFKLKKLDQNFKNIFLK